MLGASIRIRKHSTNMITYSQTEDWVSYTGELASIIEELVYFDSDASASLDVQNDDDSPYYEDENGIL